MTTIDWIVLFGTLFFIVGYGVWKTKGSKNIEGYLLGDKSLKWWTIGLSVMATQASAITFLSTPGQAFEDGMRFIQFYFGLPLAMVILSITAIPIYYRLKVYTAYEYLETRFDLKTRSLAAFLFLIQRGLGAGITIYAPAIILSTILGWTLTMTVLLIGILVIIYTVSGGSRAVSQTQKQQMAVMMGGMILAGIMVVHYLPEHVSFGDAVKVAGKMGKMNVVSLNFDLSDRYNIWSGLIGGMFLALSYFGTDQSQVARYLGGKSITESRLGLLFNGLLKVPMQFLILFIGVMVFVFYQFTMPPVFFNESAKQLLYDTPAKDQVELLEKRHEEIYNQKKSAVDNLIIAMRHGNTLAEEESISDINRAMAESNAIKTEISGIVEEQLPGANPRDTDYVFITFVMENLPVGLVGLILAVIFSAAMSSSSSELNALSSTTTVDIYKRSIRKAGSERHYLNSSKLFTLMWGLFAIGFALFAARLENLIQAVNIIGSIFYGTILGIFLAAFYFKKIKSNAVFYAALAAQLVVLYCYFRTNIAFLLYNIIGCVLVITLGYIFEMFFRSRNVQ
jgi:SSS family transporter